MQYRLDSEFYELGLSHATLYVAEGGVEIATEENYVPTKGEGIFLKQGEWASFATNGVLFARAAGASALLNVQNMVLQ